MKLSLRKLDVGDIATLERLVIENIDGLEPGLHVVDSRLLLGHSTIDLVAQDAHGTLVLVALGTKADEAMLLRIVDAYSWCLEYPDSVRRHFPAVTLSEERPPRIVFVTERVPESFLRKIKQLNVPAIDLIELRLLEVNGVAAAYFDPVARIRRRVGAVVDSVADPSARPRAERAVMSAVEGAPAHNGHSPSVARAYAIEAPSAPVAVMEPPPVSVRVFAPAPAVAPHAAAPAVAPREVMEHSVKVEMPLAAARPVREGVEPAPIQVADLAAVPDVREVAPPAAESVELPPAPLEPASAAVEPVGAPVEAMPDEPAVAASSGQPEPAPPIIAASGAARAETPEPTAEQKYLFSEAARAAQIAKDFGIELPKDGMLTRQWVDFLNQLAAK